MSPELLRSLASCDLFELIDFPGGYAVVAHFKGEEFLLSERGLVLVYEDYQEFLDLISGVIRPGVAVRFPPEFYGFQ